MINFVPRASHAFYINARNGVGINTANPQAAFDSNGAVKLTIISGNILTGEACTPENAGTFVQTGGCTCWCDGQYWASNM
jgi:hypothetical protein